MRKWGGDVPFIVWHGRALTVLWRRSCRSRRWKSGDKGSEVLRASQAQRAQVPYRGREPRGRRRRRGCGCSRISDVSMTAYVFRPVVERGVGRKTHMRETFHGFAPLFECVQAVQDEVIPETCHVRSLRNSP